MRSTLLALLLALTCCRPDAAPRTADACRDFWACPAYGLCTTSGPLCVAALDAHCLASEDCTERGACRAIGGFCRPVAATPADCSALGADRMDWCAESGRCSVVSGACVALTPQDCAASRACSIFGACTPVGGDCERGATTDAQCAEPVGSERYNPCAINGLCVARGGRCVADSDEGCRASAVCRESGFCGARGGRCVAVSEADCERAPVCASNGACALRHGGCEATDAICAARPECKERPEACVAKRGVCDDAAFIYFQF